MSYLEKRTLATISTIALLYGIYAVFAFPRLQMTDPLRSWAITMLIFGSLTIALVIIIQVLFHVLFSVGMAIKAALNNRDTIDEEKIGKALEGEFIEDERDKLLALKSSQISYIISGIGFITGLVSLVMEAPPAVMINLIFAAGYLGSVVEGIFTLILYRKGV